MEPQIQYAKTKDGVSIAFWTLGDGMPLVIMPPLIFSHLQLEWQWPELRRWFERLSERRKILRYDPRGSGLSDRDVTDLSPDAYVLDLEAVVDRVRLDTFALYAAGAPGKTAIAFADRHPGRVSHLVLWRSGAEGSGIAGPVLEPLLELADADWEATAETLAHMMLGWGQGVAAHRWAAFIRDSATPQVWQASSRAHLKADMTGLLGQVACPTLVVARGDDVRSRKLAAGIPDARLVVLEEFASIEGELDAVLRAIEEFLDEGEEPSDQKERLPEGMTAILFLDIADSTALTTKLGDAAYRERERELDASLRAAITEAGGTPVEGKVLGDGVMAVFTSARQAIDAAQRCRELGNEVGLPLHLGIHAGDVVREGNNVHGGAVQLASRVQSAAAPGEILVSATVRDLARTSAGVAFEDRGEHELKGIAEPQRLFAVRELQVPDEDH